MNELTPVQAEVLERLRPPRQGRPVWDASVRLEYQQWLEEALAPIAEQLDDKLWVSKHSLATVHGCQSRWSAERSQEFAWSVPLARGQVTHEAIRLSVHWAGEPGAEALVREALAILIDSESSLGAWLESCGDARRAQLTSECVALTSNFFDTFPPISPRWNPTTESGRYAEFCAGMIVLSGRLDLTLGNPEATTAGRVIVDIKTGSHRPEHREDLRFYALLELLRVGVAPLSVASFYVDSGRLEIETVTANSIEAATRRTIAGAAVMAAITARHHEPEETASGACRWCCRLDECETGQRAQEQRESQQQ